MFAVLEIPDYIILALMFLVFTGSSAYAALRPRDRARLFRIDRKLDMIMKHLNLDAAQLDELCAEAKNLADRGEKIAAIKVHRDQTGLGLRDAKDDVEAYLAGKATKGAARIGQRVLEGSAKLASRFRALLLRIVRAD